MTVSRAEDAYTVTYFDISDKPVAWATHPSWPVAKELAAIELVRYMQKTEEQGPFRIQIYPPIKFTI